MTGLIAIDRNRCQPWAHRRLPPPNMVRGGTAISCLKNESCNGKLLPVEKLPGRFRPGHAIYNLQGGIT